MEVSDKFHLRWKDFESNISDALKCLREEEDFFDVTLVTQDEKTIQAHKVILSACSPFFHGLLRRYRHENPLIYLKGVEHHDLAKVIHFMYQGQVSVNQAQLHSFLGVAQELKVKGLTTEENRGPRPTHSKSSSGPPTKRSRTIPVAENVESEDPVAIKAEPRISMGVEDEEAAGDHEFGESFPEPTDDFDYSEDMDDGGAGPDLDLQQHLQTLEGNKVTVGHDKDNVPVYMVPEGTRRKLPFWVYKNHGYFKNRMKGDNTIYLRCRNRKICAGTARLDLKTKMFVQTKDHECDKMN